MVYPSHYGPYNYDIPVPDAQPYDTVLAAMQASKKVLAGMEPKAESEVTEEAVAVSGNSPEKTGMQAAAENGSIFGDDISGNSGEDGSVSGNEVSAQAVEPELTAEEIASLASLPEVRADVRPWLQDFTATWVSGHIAYGPQQIREQIQAVYDAGYEEWILWNAANRYTEGGLLSADSEAAGS
ncbi:MAG: hypothetical protein IJ390_08595 [Lachnospiraceae bacterium]|nr:hypothetical protein [Lachnospiraceae bacterium]